jgi:flagellar basal-body rod modification protein FlgD
MATSFDTTLANLGINRTNAPATAQTATAANSLTSTDFITLLTAQLQNQDPTSPVDATQQITQLAQFSQVSGINDINTTLKAIQDQLSSKTTSASEAISYAGHNVLVPGDTAYARSSGGIAGGIELGADASDVRVTIEDQNGSILKTLSLGAQSQGTVNFDWNGVTDAGTDAGNGPFKVVATANTNGATVTSQPLVWAPVSSVSIPSTGAATLTLPGIGQVSTTDVRAVG